jgi:hypothetical protein
MAKKGGGFVETMFAAGVGAYAAKKAGNMSGLLWTLLKYAFIIFVLLFVLYFVMGALNIEYFSVPLKPSEKGDEKLVTPAGNVIIY